MKLHQKLKGLIEELKTLGQKSEWTAEDETEEVRIKGEIEDTKTAIAREQKRASVADSVKELDSFLNDPDTDTEITHPADSDAIEGKAGKDKSDGVLEVISHARVKNFKSAKSAYGFGMFLLAGLYGDSKAREYCKRNNIQVKKHTEGRNDVGGILVPTQYDNEIIDLRENYGVARRLLKNKPMTSDSLVTKRREGGLTAFPVGEGKKITGSDKKWGQVEMTARKWAVLARMSNELNDDSIVNEADDFVGEMSYALSFTEDNCAFNGDGTSTYHRIVGLSTKLKSLNATIANIASLQVASGNAWGEVTAADLTALMGRAPSYVWSRSPRWFCSSQFYFSVFERILDAQGGNSRTEMVNGRPTFMYKGFPVEFVQAMPQTEANSQIAAYFGDPQLAGMFGDRRGITISRSEEAVIDGESLWEQDEQAIRATERFDINWHSVGNANADATKRVSGPMVGLITAAA